MSRDAAILERTVAEALRRAKLLFTPRASGGGASGASTSGPGLVPATPNDPTKVLVGTVPPTWATPSVAFKRTTQVLTTGALANVAVENGNVAMPDTLTALLTIQADRACWVRLYTDAAAQAADAGRILGVQPTAGTGVLAEFVFTGASTIPTSPVPWLSNDEGAPASRVFYTVQNRSGATHTVTVTFGYGALT
jgi:hypothetical protein